MDSGLLSLIVIALLVLVAVPTGAAIFASRAWFRGLVHRLDRLELSNADLKRQLWELAARKPAADAAAKSTVETAVKPAPEKAASKPIDGAPPTTPKPAGTVPPFSKDPQSVTPLTAASGPTLEERLGTRWAVWLGGLALALGGIFLVRYSIEAGLLGPEVRVVLGALLAAGMIAAGEWLRRNEGALAIDALPSAHIPSILTAAGTVVAFGTIYAAHALYDFIGPTTAFAALGATGIVTMLAAALHGPALAGLGLAGAFVTPLLISSNAPSPWPVVIYLAVVAGSAYLLARARRWLWLAVSAVAGAIAWGFALLTTSGPDASNWNFAVQVHAIIQLGLAAALIAIEPHMGRDDEDAVPDWIGFGVMVALAFLMFLVLVAQPFATFGWLPFAMTAIGLLVVTAWLSAPVAIAAVLAGVVALTVVIVWPGLSAPADPTLYTTASDYLLRLPDNVSAFLTFAAFSALAVAAASALRLVRGPTLPPLTASLYALAATVPALLALVLTYLRVTQFDVSLPFAASGALLGGIFTGAALYFEQLEKDVPAPAWRIATGAFAAAAIAAFCFALVASLSRGYLTVAFALAALGTAYVSVLKDIPLLRYAVSAIGLIVLGRVVWDPRIMGDGVGQTPIFNWLLLGYGVPAFAFWKSGNLLREKADDLATRMCDGLAVVFTGLLAFFQIRHLTNNGNPLTAGTGHVEQGLLTFTALALGYLFTQMDLKRRNVVFEIGSLVLGGLAVLFAAFGLIMIANPLFTSDAVTGAPIFSSLLPGYLLPGLAALFVARTARGIRPDWYATGAAVLGVMLVFLYVTLEVRHIFNGAEINMFSRPAEGPEQWALSAAWLALGILFLAYGFWRQSIEPRMASGVLIALTAIKVCVFDLAGVQGLWRALSFILLGAVLIGIGLVYQRWIFAKPVKAAVAKE